MPFGGQQSAVASKDAFMYSKIHLGINTSISRDVVNSENLQVRIW